RPMKLAEVSEKELFRMKSSPVSISIVPGDSVRLAAAMLVVTSVITLRLLNTMRLAAAADATAKVAHKTPKPTIVLNFIRDLREIAAARSNFDTSPQFLAKLSACSRLRS